MYSDPPAAQVSPMAIRVRLLVTASRRAAVQAAASTTRSACTPSPRPAPAPPGTSPPETDGDWRSFSTPAAHRGSHEPTMPTMPTFASSSSASATSTASDSTSTRARCRRASGLQSPARTAPAKVARNDRPVPGSAQAGLETAARRRVHQHPQALQGDCVLDPPALQAVARERQRCETGARAGGGASTGEVVRCGATGSREHNVVQPPPLSPLSSSSSATTPDTYPPGLRILDAGPSFYARSPSASRRRRPQGRLGLRPGVHVVAHDAQRCRRWMRVQSTSRLGYIIM
ncbi:hypothetical protein B0H17DRAFT_1186784 [Mycena rosella]|uniref:Uncharacterized protein n=1 Tax=Mycena rosella TaxID=1033263 RepID=A0AAD7CGP4_MYCRO|nr:hypothetical protein B0H17DRAFT_1186784 [Mycena rosella]